MRQNAGMPKTASVLLAALYAPLFLVACGATAGGGSSQAPPTGHSGAHSLVLATLFSNNSAEFAAAARGCYRSAEDRLPAFVDDSAHTAALEQPTGGDARPPAIILDVDETVLDNSPYEVRLIQDGTAYPSGWAAWCNEAKAPAIPGAQEFTSWAAGMGVTVFYVTNRKAEVEAGTAKNLESLGFPMRSDIDTLLMRGEREEWTSDKTTRRAHVAKDFRIVMMFGDNLGDFLPLEDTKSAPVERRAAMAAHAEKWGREWVMIPNAMYGDWDRAILRDATDPTPAEIDRLRIQAMDARR